MPIIYAKYEGQDLRDAVQNLDAKRRHAHEHAISSCSILNRMAKQYNVSAFCPDIDQLSVTRDTIADFCAETTMLFYVEGRQINCHSIDDIISNLKERCVTIKAERAKAIREVGYELEI